MTADLAGYEIPPGHYAEGVLVGPGPQCEIDGRMISTWIIRRVSGRGRLRIAVPNDVDATLAARSLGTFVQVVRSPSGVYTVRPRPGERLSLKDRLERTHLAIEKEWRERRPK